MISINGLRKIAASAFLRRSSIRDSSAGRLFERQRLTGPRMLMSAILTTSMLSGCLDSNDPVLNPQEAEVVPGLAGAWARAPDASAALSIRWTQGNIYEIWQRGSGKAREERTMLVTGKHLADAYYLLQIAPVATPNCGAGDNACAITVIELLPKHLIDYERFAPDCLKRAGMTLTRHQGIDKIASAEDARRVVDVLLTKCKMPSDPASGATDIYARVSDEDGDKAKRDTVALAQQDFAAKADAAVMDRLAPLVSQGDLGAQLLTARAAARSRTRIDQGYKAAEDAAAKGSMEGAALTAFLAMGRFSSPGAKLFANAAEEPALRWAGLVLASNPNEPNAGKVMHLVAAAYCNQPGLVRNFKDAADCATQLQQIVIDKQKLGLSKRAVDEELVANTLEIREAKSRIANEDQHLRALDSKKSRLVESAKKDVDEMHRRANAGDANAMYQLGLLYEKGFSDLIVPDAAAAHAWFEKAAAAGDPRAASKLRMMGR